MDPFAVDACASAEERSRSCVLECDQVGSMHPRVRAEIGRSLVVVRSYAAGIVGSALCAPVVSSFDTAIRAVEGWASGPVVVGDRSVKYVAGLLKEPPSLVVFEGVETLWLPNCPDLGAPTVWMTKLSPGRVTHRGWASECFAEAVRNDAVVRRRGRERSRARESRDLYFDVRGEESAVSKAAVKAWDMDLAVAAFPGSFERIPRQRPAGECPICYEAAAPRVTSICCGRDFCLPCASECMGDDSDCPWCRRRSGLWNFSIEPGFKKAPFKDVLLADIVRTSLASSPDAKVLVVTTDETYTYKGHAGNPVAPFNPVCIGGKSASIESALRKFSAPGQAVAVAHADRMCSCGLTFPATHVVFTEAEARTGDKHRFWTNACPDAKRVRRMTAVTDALSP